MSIGVTVIDLQEGQEWTDIIPVEFRRDEANMLSVIIGEYVRQSKKVIDEARHAASDTNPDMVERIAAAMAATKLTESLKLALRCSGAIGSVVAPEPERSEIAAALVRVRNEADEEAAKEQEPLSKEDEALVDDVHEALHKATGTVHKTRRTDA